MREVLIGMIAVCCCICCTGLKEMAAPEKESEDNAWEGPGVNIAGTDTVHVCYISGIDYPKGWNWADASDGTESARCSLVVFADGVPMLKLPVGEGYKVSSDPDMHKVIDGHLYTIYCTEGYTSIRKDGKAFLKYEGEENIRELILDEENVHTLGVSRDGRGFAYRKNGDLVMERRTGYAFERLHIDSGKMCFAFCQSVATYDGTEDRYYIIRDGRASAVDFDEDVSRVWDIMSYQGKTCALVSSGPWNTTELIIGNEKHSVGLPAEAEMLSCRLFPSGSGVGIEGLYETSDGNIASGIWINGQEYMRFETGRSIAGICSTEKDICCILNPDGVNTAGTIFMNGKTWDMPDGYTCTGNNPLAISDGNLYIGLTSMTESNPVLWKNGETVNLKLNGPVCSLSVGSMK